MALRNGLGLSRFVRHPAVVVAAAVVGMVALHVCQEWWAREYVESLLRPPGVVDFVRGIPSGGRESVQFTEFWLDTEANAVRLVRAVVPRPEQAGTLWVGYTEARYLPPEQISSGYSSPGQVTVNVAYDDSRAFATSGQREARRLLTAFARERLGQSRLLALGGDLGLAVLATLRGDGAGGDLGPREALFVHAVHLVSHAVGAPSVHRVDRASLPPEMFVLAVPEGWRSEVTRYYPPELASGFEDYPIYWAGPTVGEYTLREILVSEADQGGPFVAELPFPPGKNRLATAVYALTADWRSPRLSVQTGPVRTSDQQANWEYLLASGRIRDFRPAGETVRLGEHEGIFTNHGGFAEFRTSIGGLDVKVSTNTNRPESSEVVMQAVRVLRRVN